jgi:hypothetical protein
MTEAESLRTLHLSGFSAVVAKSVSMILDIEYPRLGIVTIESFDQAMIDLRQTMNSSRAPSTIEEIAQ